MKFIEKDDLSEEDKEKYGFKWIDPDYQKDLLIKKLYLKWNL